MFCRRPSAVSPFAQWNSDRRTSDNSVILECDDMETIDDTSVRMTTSIDPLVPGYQLTEPTNDIELPFPPEYLTTVLNNTKT